MKLSRDPTDNKLIKQELEISKQYGNYMKVRRHTNRIFGVKDNHGEKQEGIEEISKAFFGILK